METTTIAIPEPVTDCACKRTEIKVLSATRKDSGVSVVTGQVVCLDCGEVQTQLTSTGYDDVFRLTFGSGLQQKLAEAREAKSAARAANAKPAATARSSKKNEPDPSLSRSKINRNGLPPGTPAPEFTLPRLDGGAAVALADYRGRQVLIVFVGSDCQYCDDVAPDLQRLHDSGFAVLVIGQASEAAMRDKVAEFGWNMPVVMQRKWEISKLYGRFALPVGNLIDADGVLVEEAVGNPALPLLIDRLIVPLTTTETKE